MRNHVELILFNTYCELRAERSRTYMGFIWWVLEPALFMLVFYLVFAVVLKSGGPKFLPFLLVGLTIWQWFKSCVSHGGSSILMQLPLIREVAVPPLVFPTVLVLTDTVKFVFIFALLLVVLWASGYPPNAAYAALPVVLAIELIFAAGATYLVAAVVPLIPDLRYVIENLLQALMFVSGVVFALDAVPEPWRAWFALNPVAALVDGTRVILLDGQWPDWSRLGNVALISVAMLVLGVIAVHLLAPRYPKLAA